MNRETLLAGGAAVVLAVALLVAALVPGVVARPEQDVRPGRLDIEEVTIAPGAVSGSTAILRVTTYLTHYGGPSENVTVEFRAIDLDTGFVETTRAVEVGGVAGEREEVAVVGNLSVERSGGYRVETIVYQDGRRLEVGGKQVRGVGTLQPAYARTNVGFHRFGEAGAADLPVVEFAIEDVEGNTTTLAVRAHLTNAGNDPEGDLRLVLKARQADSNIVADEASVAVGEIAPGRTATPGAGLTVATEYNYYLDAILWKDGVIVATARAAANLDPTETISVNRTRREIGLEVSDFERDDRKRERPAAEETPTPVAASQPGFGIPAAAMAAVLLAAGLLLRRRYR